jgi:hypothetical protein
MEWGPVAVMMPCYCNTRTSHLICRGKIWQFVVTEEIRTTVVVGIWSRHARAIRVATYMHKNVRAIRIGKRSSLPPKLLATYKSPYKREGRCQRLAGSKIKRLRDAFDSKEPFVPACAWAPHAIHFWSPNWCERE